MTVTDRATAEPAEAEQLLRFIDAAPSPFHAVAEAANRLDAAGFSVVDPTGTWPARGRSYVRRGGSLVAWATPDDVTPATPFHIIGAHTDSPNLRIKPRPDTGCAGWRQLGVEVSGGALVKSWLDHDLGLSGRVMVRDGHEVVARLVKVDRPLLRVPQLAIHLDPEITAQGLKLNRQTHLAPVWDLGEPDGGGFLRFLAGELGLDPVEVLGWDVMAHDLTPSTLLGRSNDLISAPRLDNLCSSFAAVRALEEVMREDATPGAVPVVCLFEHEEVGSVSSTGADSTLLPAVLERTVLASGGDRDDLHRSLAGSLCASADMAHATHPNYAERHEPDHPITVNGGPVLKVNANQRYATDGLGAAAFAVACATAGVPLQRFVSRTDMPCGSTIGPVTASRLGVTTFDVGVAQLAMHSVRELAGAADPAYFVRALSAFLRDSRSSGG
ncbi:M18 family aminopeptidase [soil metagenome]